MWLAYTLGMMVAVALDAFVRHLYGAERSCSILARCDICLEVRGESDDPC